MSMPGELTVIARIAQVDMAVITNVGIRILSSWEVRKTFTGRS